VKVGDVIRVKTGSGYFEDGEDTTCQWPESKGQVGVIVAKAKRLYIPAAKVLVLGEIAEFDLDELEPVSESG
jgi:hypothetical protein